MNRKNDNQRARRPILPVLSIVLVVFAITALFIVFTRFDVTGIVYNRVQRGGSQSTLTAIRDISRLETVAYVRRTVFPHDYLLPDLQLADLVRIVSLGGGNPAEALSPREYLHYRAANLASRLGLATRRDQNGYVVITAVYRFGYETGPLTDYLELADRENLFSDLPPGELLSIDIEDLRREDYPYGPVTLDADGWKRVSAFIVEEELPVSVREDLALQSRDQALLILRRLIPMTDPDREGP